MTQVLDVGGGGFVLAAFRLGSPCMIWVRSDLLRLPLVPIVFLVVSLPRRQVSDPSLSSLLCRSTVFDAPAVPVGPVKPPVRVSALVASLPLAASFSSLVP